MNENFCGYIVFCIGSLFLLNLNCIFSFSLYLQVPDRLVELWILWSFFSCTPFRILNLTVESLTILYYGEDIFWWCLLEVLCDSCNCCIFLFFFQIREAWIDLLVHSMFPHLPESLRDIFLVIWTIKSHRSQTMFFSIFFFVYLRYF